MKRLLLLSFQKIILSSKQAIKRKQINLISDINEYKFHCNKTILIQKIKNYVTKLNIGSGNKNYNWKKNLLIGSNLNNTIPSGYQANTK